MKKEEYNKKIRKIVLNLFDDGKKYGKNTGVMGDDYLYTLRINACDNAIEELDEIFTFLKLIK